MEERLSQFRTTLKRKSEHTRKKQEQVQRNVMHTTKQPENVSTKEDFSNKSFEKLKEKIRLEQSMERKTDIIIYILLILIISVFAWILL